MLPPLVTLSRLVCAALLLLAATILNAQPHPLHESVRDLVGDDPEKRVAAVYKIGISGHPLAKELLDALANDGLMVNDDASQIFLITKNSTIDLLTGKEVTTAPSGLESAMITNAVRSALDQANAALALTLADPEARRNAARSLLSSTDAALLPIVEEATRKESDDDARTELLMTVAMLKLQFGSLPERQAAAKSLADSNSPVVQRTLSGLLKKNTAGEWVEPDSVVRQNAAASIEVIENRLRKFEIFANLFSGLSLGSILLLAALGLAITYGLMGVINMAHGEFLMIGAYVTFLTQGLFRNYFPDAFALYVLAAIPLAFLITGAIGVILERTVLRWLYGRPLETLLTTWGVSLLLIQGCRTIFGAQNVEVENPFWLSGGITLAGDLVIPWNRIMIVGFAIFVVGMVAILLTRTRAGLYVRGVTQNRSMAACNGVATDKVDMLTFGFGSGIAGLGGVALSQIGNVGPDLGQQYIVDSFMVVVLGGVGQLAGTIIAALGLGSVTKLLEPMTGAVLAKISVLVFIILFIQKRPQGLFALKGRSAET
jgi:urea transport system permease protein